MFFFFKLNLDTIIKFLFELKSICLILNKLKLYTACFFKNCNHLIKLNSVTELFVNNNYKNSKLQNFFHLSKIQKIETLQKIFISPMNEISRKRIRSFTNFNQYLQKLIILQLYKELLNDTVEIY